MSTDGQQVTGDEPADWATERAADELYQTPEPAGIADRARELERQAAERHEERHDEYDDPDEGGEA